MILLKNIFLISLFVFFASALQSQDKVKNYKLSHPIKSGAENSSHNPKDFIQGVDSFKVVAILVQFQLDNDQRTTGDGHFDLSNRYLNTSTGKDTVIDAPPYDSAYFADHLKFLKNYFTKASKGKTEISYDLYPQVLTLPYNMQHYSPQRGESNYKLGELFRDSWAIADSSINFSVYDPDNTAFIIFHAGVGRDVDLASILGIDPTPYDIPSVYLGLKNLREFYGPTYNGFQTLDGFFIANSAIIPSTELREISSLGQTYLIELGVNGILAANFGSYLGLPDLFNTSNGKTAIGRFGLMDGQSLFSYNGIFPPEPSAWEKIYLGWVDPVVISSGSKIVSLPTSSVNQFRDSTVYKVLINSKEYFLIENKNRDPENNGQTIYSRNRAFNDVQTFTRDIVDTGFYYSQGSVSLYLLNGNVTDVENFDWSLPGLITGTSNYRGGVLIWHIDENVIDANISSNTINNDINHKGVDLEEAKGAQEIGVTFSTPFGDITGDGTNVDYWFNGDHSVPSTIYQNAFTPTSIPNSLSYSLTNNNIFITSFSEIDTLMTMQISVGSPQIKTIAGFPKFVGVDSSGNSQAIAIDLSGNISDELFVNSNNSLFGYGSNGNSLSSDSTGLLIAGYGKYIPAYIKNGNSKYLAALNSNSASVYFYGAQPVTANYGNSIASCPPVSVESNENIYIGTTTGGIRKVNPISPFITVDSAAGPLRQFSKIDADTFTYITTQNKYVVIGNILNSTSTDILTVNNSNEFFINGSKLNLNYSLSVIKSSPVLADINSDSKQEIIFVGDNKVYALNSNGVLIENFPVNFNREISSGISVADVNNDNIFDLVFASANGELYAYGINGKVVPGFPVLIGKNTTSTPAFANLNDTLGIIAVSGDGYLYGFQTNIAYNESKILWKNYLKDKYLSNNNFNSGNQPVNYSGKLPSDKVYNWPNPVYNNETFIRYYINGNASNVNVRVLDLSGELVATLKATSFSKSDNEVKWDVTDVQSGIYYGVIEAEIDGSKETQIIKIAVVK